MIQVSVVFSALWNRHPELGFARSNQDRELALIAPFSKNNYA